MALGGCGDHSPRCGPRALSTYQEPGRGPLRLAKQSRLHLGELCGTTGFSIPDGRLKKLQKIRDGFNEGAVRLLISP